MFITIIIGAILLFATIGVRAFGYTPIYSLLVIVFLTILVVIQDGVFAALIRKLPAKYFDHSRKGFDASKKERKFYDFIQIKFWKDYVPELGGFTNFHKDKIRESNNLQYLERFILECNYGSAIHIFTALSGFIILFALPSSQMLIFGVPVAVVNLFLNLMPAFILRYNVPRLRTLHKMAKRKAKGQ